jgi:REP element-mobilizing transposase RayT
LIGRGFERRDIFAEDSSKRDFLCRLEKNLRKSGAQCLAWALMSNHYHLLVRSGNKPLGKLMAPVLTGYALHYNRLSGRSGYVYQNRFESILSEEQTYFLTLVRYIHLNPVKAKLVNSIAELDRYPWTGHATVIGNASQSWMEVDQLLSHFGSAREPARRKYRRFVKEGIGKDDAVDLSGGGLIRSCHGWENLVRLRREHTVCIGDERILGSSEFVQAALAEDELKVDKYSQRQREGWDFDTLKSAVCKLFDVAEGAVLRRVRATAASDAKSLLCYWAVEELGMTVVSVAKELGVSQQAASWRVQQGAEVCARRSLDFGDLA